MKVHVVTGSESLRVQIEYQLNELGRSFTFSPGPDQCFERSVSSEPCQIVLDQDGDYDCESILLSLLEKKRPPFGVIVMSTAPDPEEGLEQVALAYTNLGIPFFVQEVPTLLSELKESLHRLDAATNRTRGPRRDRRPLPTISGLGTALRMARENLDLEVAQVVEKSEEIGFPLSSAQLLALEGDEQGALISASEWLYLTQLYNLSPDFFTLGNESLAQLWRTKQAVASQTYPFPVGPRLHKKLSTLLNASAVGDRQSSEVLVR